MKKVIRLLICIAMTIILTVGCEDKDIDNTNFNNENQSVNYDIDVTSNNLTNENKVERSTDEFDSISSIKGECNVWVLVVGQGSSTLVESDG